MVAYMLKFETDNFWGGWHTFLYSVLIFYDEINSVCSDTADISRKYYASLQVSYRA